MASEKIIVKIMPEIFDLIPGYLQNRENDIKLISDALANNDMEVLRKKGHDMKGSGKGYGFDTISEIGEKIEMAAKSGESKIIEEQLVVFKDYLERVEPKADN